MKIYLVVLGIACMSTLARAQLVPVPIELPKPGYEGTPANLTNIPNLEKQSVKQRAPFLAPPGVTNIAKGKKVTSTDTDPVVGDVSMITSGDAAQVDGNFVELGPGVQSVTIDLGSAQEIYGILFWHHYQPRVYYGIVVQTADDEKFTTNKQTWFNSDTGNKARQGAGKDMLYVESNAGKLVPVKGVAARYVRLYSCGNNVNELNHYIQVEVFGRPAK